MYSNDPLKWNHAAAKHFWSKIAHHEHVVQIYEQDEIFIDTLAGFVDGGMLAGDCVIVIATNAHLLFLFERLKKLGIDIGTVIRDDQLIPLDAGTTLSSFLIDDWPNEELFTRTFSELLQRASRRNRRVRAFREMVAVLWTRGRYGAAVNLEHLWNKFCSTQTLSLFCAYPKSGFITDINQSITGICKCHSKVIDGSKMSSNEIVYRNVT